MKDDIVQFEIIVGTYEEFVLGYQYKLKDGNEKGELSQTFATHSHRASVRAVASKGRLVVSGGADETINIYDMLTRKESGMLMEHNGTVTSLNFTPDCSHLISTSEDGSIKIFRQGSWQLEKVWSNAHKGAAVTWLSIHPSGKMALSVGKDHTLRTWNLVKGRPAYTTNLYSRCRQLECVVWSPGGEVFAIPMDNTLELSSIQKAGVLHTLKLQTKVSICTFLSDAVVCVGESSGEVSGHCTRSARELWRVTGDQRVRGLAYLHGYLVTASSGGIICVYSVADETQQPQPVVSADTGCRITCLTLYDHKSVMKVKQELSEETKSNEGEKTTSIKSDTKKRKEFVISEETTGLKELKSFSKKQKILRDKKEISECVCSPRNQKWIVKDSIT